MAEEAARSGGRDERYVLAVDLGTGGPKVGLVSVTGRVAAQDHFPVETRWLGEGGAVQDAERWWQIIVQATKDALASGAVPADRVVAVSVTGQWASTVPVDERGHPVDDCVMWMDTRGGRYSRERFGGPIQGYAPRALATFLRRTGGMPSLSGADPIGARLHLDRDRPDVARAARWYLEPVDYLSMRFTGIAAASPASVTAHWLTDNRRLDLIDYDPQLVRLAGVDPDKLPPLVATGSLIGTVQASVADELGIPTTAHVVTGVPDLHTAPFGAGAVLDYEANMAMSTTSWISCPVGHKKTDPIHMIATIPGITLGKYLVANNQDTAGRCFEWLRDSVLGADDGLFDGAAPAYAALTELAATSPPGAGNVVFTPWLNGERSPIADEDARAGFHNLSLATTRADLVRAVLEGVAYNSRWLLDSVEKFAKRRLDPIRIIGGGAVSDLWCQIIADVTDHTIERVVEPLHAGIRGAAVFAGVALGDVRLDEVRNIVAVDTTFRPDPENRAVYGRLASELPKLHKAQKAMFGRLNGR